MSLSGPVKPGQYKFWLRKNNPEVVEENRKLPRAIQAFKNQRQSPYVDRDKVLTDSKMPDSSAGDSPRSQPTKPVRAGYTPSSVRAARSLLFRTRTSSNGENDDDTDIKPKTFVRPSPSTTPKSSKFSGLVPNPEAWQKLPWR